MLNLRQLHEADSTEASSDTQHFSQVSINFRAPSDLLGNIGEPLDHSQSKWLHEDDHSMNSDSDGSVFGPSGAQWEDGDEGSLDTIVALVSPSGNGVDDGPRSSLQSTGSTSQSGVRGDEVIDALHAPDHADGADTSSINCTEKVRLCSCSLG